MDSRTAAACLSRAPRYRSTIPSEGRETDSRLQKEHLLAQKGMCA